MSGSSARSMTFQATAPEAFAALRQAADRTGLRYLSGDGVTGTYVFTAGTTLMSFGEKVTAQITQLDAETVQVTLSSDLQFGVKNCSHGLCPNFFPFPRRFASLSAARSCARRTRVRSPSSRCAVPATLVTLRSPRGTRGVISVRSLGGRRGASG